jgi:hypothetical protein
MIFIGDKVSGQHCLPLIGRLANEAIAKKLLVGGKKNLDQSPLPLPAIVRILT